MPPKKTGVKRPRSALSAGPVGISRGVELSDYRSFINSLHNKTIGKRAKDKISPGDFAKWKEPITATDQGRIINEIAKKFNSIPGTISKATYKARGPSGSSYYWPDGNGQPNLDLVPEKNLKDGPNPTVVGHELVHANDHQARIPVDRLNPKVWGHLGTLATTGGANSGAMRDLDEFGTSVGKIQDKIIPGGEFKASYPIDESYIKKDIEGAAAGEGGSAPYTTPLTGGVGSAPDWPQLFNRINDVVTHVSAPGTPPNQDFYLNRASEFPAFMSENLTRPWGANTAPNPLSLPEARFIHSTLGNMETAYPAADYPTMNNYIGQRRNSLERAYYPGTPANGAAPAIPAGPPEGGFSRGGRVTGKNLLSRFKKI